MPNKEFWKTIGYFHHRVLDKVITGPLVVLSVWIFVLLITFVFLKKNGTERDFNTGLMKKSEGLSYNDDEINCSYEKIDFQRVEQRVVEKIKTAQIKHVPFSHVFVEGIFSERVYACVLRHLANDTENLKYVPMENWPGRNSIPLKDAVSSGI
jgi:hypothetical protein